MKNIRYELKILHILAPDQNENYVATLPFLCASRTLKYMVASVGSSTVYSNDNIELEILL